jgi:hypothetical protein
MFALRNLIEALASIVSLALTIYMWVIIARALLSWVNPDPYNPIVRFFTTTERSWVVAPCLWSSWSGSRPAARLAGHHLPEGFLAHPDDLALRLG